MKRGSLKEEGKCSLGRKNCMCRGLQVYDVVGEEKKSVTGKKSEKQQRKQSHRKCAVKAREGIKSGRKEECNNRKQLQILWILMQQHQ